jgi:hypothetical protein
MGLWQRESAAGVRESARDRSGSAVEQTDP